MSGDKRRVFRFGIGSARDLRMAENLRASLARGVPMEAARLMAAGYRHREKQAARARAGAATKADDKARDNETLRARVAQARLDHPRASTRTIARLLLGRVPPTAEGQRAIDAMRQRIARLEEK